MNQSIYYSDTVKMLNRYVESEQNLNVFVDFFAQLSQLRKIYMHAIVIAINSKEKSYDTLLRDAIQKERWMTQISLIDIRTHICFLMIAEYNLVIPTEPFVKDVNDAIFLSYHRKSVIGENIKNIGVLIETCYYIDQIRLLKQNKDIPADWAMFHEYIHGKKLDEIVYFVYELLKPILL